MAEAVLVLDTKMSAVSPTDVAPPTLPPDVVQVLNTVTRYVMPITLPLPTPIDVVQVLDTTLRMVSPKLVITPPPTPIPEPEPKPTPTPEGIKWWVWAILGVALVLVLATIIYFGRKK